MEEGIEELQTTGVEINFDSYDIDSIFDSLLQSSIPDCLKKKLYFLQSD